MSALILLVAIAVVLSVSRAASVSVSTWLTRSDSQGSAINLLTPGAIQGSIQFGKSEVKTRSNVDILWNADSKQTRQKIMGFGAGLPQSSAFVLAQLKTKNVEVYNGVMEKLFDPKNGAGFNILRFPLGSCDFSIRNTSYDEFQNDYSLSHFAIDEDSQYIIDVIHDALRLNPKMTFIGSPWSSPSWLKTWDTLLGFDSANTLIDSNEAYDTYASYFRKAVDAYHNAGVDLSYLTLQNEPLFGDNSQYPGMFLSSENAFRLGSLVVDKLAGTNVQLLGYDHNWDNYSYPMDLLTKQRQSADQKQVFVGTAWHCYGGDMATALDKVGSAYPDMEQHITECTGGFPDDECDISRGMEGFGWNHEWDMTNLFLGALGHGARSGTKWILALDEQCGPVLPDVGFRWGRPFVSIPSTSSSLDDVKFNQDYWTTYHMSRFVERDSMRVQSTLTSVRGGPNQVKDILAECFQGVVTSDLSKTRTTCMAMNTNHNTDVSMELTYHNRDGSQVVVPVTVPSWGTVIMQWDL